MQNYKTYLKNSYFGVEKFNFSLGLSSISYSEVFYEFLEIRIPSCEKFISLQTRIKSSLRHCRIKKGKETRSFLIRSPFDTYPSQTSKNQDFTIREMILCGNIAKKSNLKTRCLKRVRTNNIVVIRTE